MIVIRAVEQLRFVVEDLTDPQELEKAAARHARFKRNLAWYTEHDQEISERYRGKCICIAGEELFVSDDPREVLRRAGSAPRRRRILSPLHREGKRATHLFKSVVIGPCAATVRIAQCYLVHWRSNRRVIKCCFKRLLDCTGVASY